MNSDMGVQIVDSICDDGHVDCNDLLSSITGIALFLMDLLYMFTCYKEKMRLS